MTDPTDLAQPFPGAPGRAVRHRRMIGREPALVPPLEVLLRYNARILDPMSAVRLGREKIWPTVYLADRLLVTNYAEVHEDLETVVHRLRLGVRADRDDVVLAERLKGAPVPVRVRLVSLDEQNPAAPADAWLVVQSFRAFVTDDARRGSVQLDHLMTACADIDGLPFAGSQGIAGLPFAGSQGVGRVSAQYGMPGLGGLTPVTWVGAAPHRRSDAEVGCRRPVVAVLDTAVGKHPWLPDGVVVREPKVGGELIGLPGSGGSATSEDPFEGVLDGDAGHGTFIAGLVRQMCPDATILAVRVMPTSGAVPEGELLHAMWQLVQRQQAGLAPGHEAELIDVVSMSLGYYHEQPEDAQYDPKLLAPIEALSELGVAVVASAGNQSTDRVIYPAAFAPYEGGLVPAFRADRIPVITVGALNPDRSVALFSNAGPWVHSYRAGAAVVSTMPPIDGGALPTYEVHVPHYGRRKNIDPDNFYGGFGSWSGTSFSAPILAGQLAQTLLDGNGVNPMNSTDPDIRLTRAWAAVTTQTGVVRP